MLELILYGFVLFLVIITITGVIAGHVQRTKELEYHADALEQDEMERRLRNDLRW